MFSVKFKNFLPLLSIYAAQGKTYLEVERIRARGGEISEGEYNTINFKNIVEFFVTALTLWNAFYYFQRGFADGSMGLLNSAILFFSVGLITLLINKRQYIAIDSYITISLIFILYMVGTILVEFIIMMREPKKWNMRRFLGTIVLGNLFPVYIIISKLMALSYEEKSKVIPFFLLKEDILPYKSWYVISENNKLKLNNMVKKGDVDLTADSKIELNVLTDNYVDPEN